MTTRICAIAVGGFTLLANGGCTNSGVRERLGALPFPGFGTLYASVNPADLGGHRSSPSVGLPFAMDERGRGIVYTRRAGFVDVAHVREAADWTRTVHTHLTANPDEPETEIELDYHDATLLAKVRWAHDPSAREAQANRISAHLAYLLCTWHEIATWYGYGSMPLISEKRSSFTWDDTTSHILGVNLGEAVLASKSKDWDRAIEAHLPLILASYGAVSRYETDDAADSVEGDWWAHGQPLRRDFDIGLPGGQKTPWTVGDDQLTCGTLAAPTLWTGDDVRASLHVRGTTAWSVPWGLKQTLSEDALSGIIEGCAQVEHEWLAEVGEARQAGALAPAGPHAHEPASRLSTRD